MLLYIKPKWKQNMNIHVNEYPSPPPPPPNPKDIPYKHETKAHPLLRERGRGLAEVLCKQVRRPPFHSPMFAGAPCQRALRPSPIPIIPHSWVTCPPPPGGPNLHRNEEVEVSCCGGAGSDKGWEGVWVAVAAVARGG